MKKLVARARDNVPVMRDEVPARNYHWDYVNSTDERQYAHLGDAWRWMTINLWLWRHTRSYVEFFPIEYTYFRWQSTRLAIDCREADICTGCIAIPSTILTPIQETKWSTVQQRLQCWLQCRLQCRIQWRLQNRLQCHICFDVTLPGILPNRSWQILGNPELHNYDDNCQLQSTSESTPSNRCSITSHMISVAGRATRFKRGGWLYRNLKQSWPQTITFPEVQEQSTTTMTRRRASEHTPRSKTMSSPSIRRTSSSPANVSEKWQVKWAWSMPNECDMATEAVPKEIENHHRAYRIVHRMASKETVETTTERWWPRSHSDRYHCQRTSHGDRMRGLPGALPYQPTDRDAYRMAYRTIKYYRRTEYRTECGMILPNDFREANGYSTEAAYRDGQGKSTKNAPEPSSEWLLPRSGPPRPYQMPN